MKDLIQRLREGEFEMNPLLLMDEAADALEKQQAEIEGWKEDQKENLRNQCDLQAEINTLKAQAAKDAAEIEELKIQGAKLSEAVYLLSEGNVTLIKERDSLKAQAANDAADAGRYRWLASEKSETVTVAFDQDPNQDDTWTKVELDAAIDAAMKESQQ